MRKRKMDTPPLLALIKTSEASGTPISEQLTHELHPTLSEAIRIVTAAGLQVGKPKKQSMQRVRNLKDRVGPTFVCQFADGVTTRMSVFTSLDRLDWDRGMRLSQAAYQSRWRTRVLAQYLKQNGYLRLTRWQYREPAINLIAPVPPAIIAVHFEQDGRVLAQRTNGNAS